ncbi:MAG: cupin domain-containing protein [Nitrososphaerota archaeon]|nr:cupin domain-containing protein [Candidatus Bathyarchaeota archaeon]MDW8022747.1 cupin domain-containing protein [Nitrososphaerota archaeon]
MKIMHYSEVKAESVEEGASKLKVRWLITKDVGAENFAMRLFELEPGGYSPLHSHPWEHEVFILEGEGVVLGDYGQREFKPGDAIFIPPNEKHQFRNNGGKTLKFLCMVPTKTK